MYCFPPLKRKNKRPEDSFSIHLLSGPFRLSISQFFTLMKNIFILVLILLAFVAAKGPSLPGFMKSVFIAWPMLLMKPAWTPILKKHLIPALHRKGIKKVGVFKPIKEDTIYNKRIYVLIPYKSLNEFEKTNAALQKDAQYLADGSDYINASHTDPPYTRMETIVLKSFRFMPAPAVPNLKAPKQERVYEFAAMKEPQKNCIRVKCTCLMKVVK